MKYIKELEEYMEDKIIIKKNPNGDTRTAKGDITFEDFSNAKSEILWYINDPETIDDRIRVIDTYKIIDFFIYEFDNNILDPQVSTAQLADINRRFNKWS